MVQLTIKNPTAYVYLYLFPAWEVTMATARCPCQTGGSGRRREHHWSSHSRGWQPGASRTHGHGQYFIPMWDTADIFCNSYSWPARYLSLLDTITLSLSAVTRLGDTRAVSLVPWLCLMCCWEGSSGALLHLLLLWLWSTPCSHQRKVATNAHHCPSSPDHNV